MKILFISHEATKTGAPLVLLYFLQWLRQHHPEIHITTLAMTDGILKDDFIRVSDEYIDFTVFGSSKSKMSQRLFKRIKKKLGLKSTNPENKFLHKAAALNFDLIYANTIVSIPIAQKIKVLSKTAKLFVHVHELNLTIQSRLPNFSYYTKEIDLFLAVSKAVKRNLINTYRIPAVKIHTVYEFSTVNQIKGREGGRTFTVGGAGTAYWRKGSDLFLQVARFTKVNYPEISIEFIWVGSISKEQMRIINADIEKAGLEDIISFIGEKENPHENYSNFDVFLMTSREDPFPLVCIEAGMLGKPIICFEGATGTAEIISEGGGFIVPYLSIESMAEKIIYYVKNREAREKDGEMAKILFSEFTPEKMCPKIFMGLESMLTK